MKHLLIFLFFSWGTLAFSEEVEQKKKIKDAFLASRSYSYTLNILVEQLTEDLRKKVSSPTNAAITKFTMSSNLPQEFENYSILKIVQAVSKSGGQVRLTKCIECLSVNMELKNEETLIKKGISDLKELEKVLTQYNVKYYSEFNLSLVGNTLILTHVIYTKTDHSVVYSNEFSSGIYSIRDDGLIFGLSLGSLMPASHSMIGGQAYLGQRVTGLGDVGMKFLSFTSPAAGAISGVGIMVDLNINELFSSYWQTGSIYFANGLNFMAYKGNSQISYSLGVKYKFGLIFHTVLQYSLFKVLKLKEIEAPETGDFTIDPNKNFPGALFLGLGMDFG